MAEQPKTQRQIAIASAVQKRNGAYQKLQAYLRTQTFKLDSRYNSGYTDYTQVPEIWEAKRINKLKPKLLEELRDMEEVKFTADSYKNFSEQALDCMARRVAVRNDTDILLTWFAEGMDEIAVARMLGFSSARLMLGWARKNDNLCQTALVEAIHSGMEGLGRDYMDRAESLTDKIGTVKMPDGDMSASILAFEFRAAAEDGDEEKKFMLQQYAPLLESALKWDAERKKALAKHFVTRAGHYSAEYRPQTVKDTAQVIHGGINITLDLGVQAEQQPHTKQVNAPIATQMSGAVLDMEP